MATIATSADGEYIFIALEDLDGLPLIARASRDDLSTWSSVYAPGAGTAANIMPCVAKPDLMFFYGNFGSGVQVIEHVVSTGAETNISPAGLTTKVVNALAINPSNSEEIAITVNTDQDLKYSSDGGTNWSDWSAALGFDATALAVLWSGQYQLNRYLVAGDNGADLDLLYSPNQGANSSNMEDASLEAQAAICAIEVRET